MNCAVLINFCYIYGHFTLSAMRNLKLEIDIQEYSSIDELDAVDRKLVEYGKNKRIVMDGRDIGTSVFPNADLKIFMVADDNVRAERRLKEMRASGQNPDFKEVLENLKTRDYIDSHRETSPLRQASDAIVLDNTDMTPDDQMDWIRNLVKEKFGA